MSACSPSTEETTAAAAATAPAGNFDFEGWDQYLGGADSSQYSSLAQIDKSNVGQLEVAWTYPTGDNYSFNPLVVGNTMYVLAKGRSIVALDAATGREIWSARERRRRRHARHELLAQPRRQPRSACCTSTPAS